MNARELKLSIACEKESDEIKSLNKFFEDLFSDILLYTDNINSTYYVKNNVIIMEYVNSFYNEPQLWCKYIGFFEILEKYNYNHDDICDIIRYKVDEFFNIKNIIHIEVIHLMI